MKYITPIWNYLFKILIWLDQGLNIILFNGRQDHTISGRVGYYAIKGVPKYLFLEKIINAMFFFHPNHCRRSIEWLILSRDGIKKPE